MPYEELWTFKNKVPVVGICDFDMYRARRPPLGFKAQPPCGVCIRPYEGCAKVPKTRVYAVAFGFSNWLFEGLTSDELAWIKNTAFQSFAMNYSVETGCVWRGTDYHERAELLAWLRWTSSLTVVDSAAGPGLVDYTLTFKMEGKIGDDDDTGQLTLTYTNQNEEVWPSIAQTTQSVIMTTATAFAGRRYHFVDGVRFAQMPNQIVLNYLRDVTF